MNISITKLLIFLNIIISLKTPFIHYIIKVYEFYTPSNLDINKPFNLFIPYFYNSSILSLITSMYVFNYIGTILEKFYRRTAYCKILFLSFSLTSFIAYMLCLIFKYIFEYSDFYYSSYSGFIPILLCLRMIYFNILNKELYVHGFLIHSKNLIWIELLILNIFDPMHRFYIHLAGILSGNIIYNYFIE